MSNVITLTVGDPWHDGHGKSKTINIFSNLDKKNLLDAYEKGSKIVGFNFIKNICADYEDYHLSADYFEILREHGLTIADLRLSSQYDIDEATKEFDDGYLLDGMDLNTDSYTGIFLFIAKLGNPDFECEVMKSDLNPRLDIGGYGLFS